MSKKICPFCKRYVNNHHPQCHHGGVPSADDVKSLLDRKKIVDKRKLNKTKSALLSSTSDNRKF